MAVEILTVSLSDESIERIANAIADMLLPATRATTHSNHPSPQNPQGAERSGFRQESRAPQQSDDGWDQPQQRQQPQDGQEGPPMCNCGDPKRWVPPGYSERSGKSYPGFWACPRPRGQQCGR